MFEVGVVGDAPGETACRLPPPAAFTALPPELFLRLLPLESVRLDPNQLDPELAFGVWARTSPLYDWVLCVRIMGTPLDKEVFADPAEVHRWRPQPQPGEELFSFRLSFAVDVEDAREEERKRLIVPNESS